MPDQLEIALEACEKRCGFWKAITFAACGALMGVLTGAMPLAFRDLATQEYVDQNGPYVKASGLLEARLSDVEDETAKNNAQLSLVTAQMAQVNGKLDALLVLMVGEESEKNQKR